MKKALAVLCSLAIMLVCVGGCGAAGENPFTAENAIKGQIGDLYYVVPGNAVFTESSTDSACFYSIPIENSSEEYILSIRYYSFEADDEYNEAIQLMENTTQELDNTTHEYENLTEFLGENVDYGIKVNYDVDGQKSVGVSVAKDHKCYMIQYRVKSGFYDQAVWDNFYAQLKFV